MDARTLHIGIAAFAFVAGIATGGIVLCTLNGMHPPEVLGNVAVGCTTGIGAIFAAFRPGRYDRHRSEDSDYSSGTEKKRG